MANPEQLFLQRFEEAFNTAVAFRFTHKGRRRFDAQETDLVLEVAAHELRPVVMAELETISGVGLEAAEVLVDALTDRFEGFEARGAFHGMNADALGRTVIKGGKDSDLAIIERYRRRRINAPHLVRPVGGDGAGMRFLCDGNEIVALLQKKERKHKAMFKDDKIASAFPSTTDYYFQKIYESILASKSSHYGRIHVELIVEVIECFKARLAERGLAETYNSVKHHLDLVSYPVLCQNSALLK